MEPIETEKLVTHEDLAKQLLYQRHQKEFEIEKVVGQDIFAGVYTVLAYPEDKAELIFRATINSDGTGISDNYVAKLLAVQLSDLIAHNLDELSGIYYVYSSFMFDPIELVNADMDICDYVKAHPTNRYNTYLYYVPDTLDVDACYQCLSEAYTGIEGINGTLYINILDEEAVSSVQNYIESHDKLYDDYKKFIEPYCKGKLQVKNSKIVNSKEDVKAMLEK